MCTFLLVANTVNKHVFPKDKSERERERDRGKMEEKFIEDKKETHQSIHHRRKGFLSLLWVVWYVSKHVESSSKKLTFNAIVLIFRKKEEKNAV